MEKIDPRYLLIRITGILDSLKILYLVTGGIAVLIWGRPRFTADIDIVVELKRSHLKALVKKLQDLGEDSYIDPMSAEQALLRSGEFNFIDGETGVKVDFWILRDDLFDKSRLGRRREKEILGKKVYFTSPEDLILIKLQWHKESQSSRQLEDVESILKISGGELDINYLNDWAAKLNVSDILNNLLSPP